MGQTKHKLINVYICYFIRSNLIYVTNLMFIILYLNMLEHLAYAKLLRDPLFHVVTVAIMLFNDYVHHQQM